MSATETDAARHGKASEATFPAPDLPLEARGSTESDSATAPLVTGQINAKKGFSKASVSPYVPIRIAFPELWPDTDEDGILFKLEYLLGEDADREQKGFLGLSDEDRRAAQYQYDCRLLSLLAVEPPEGIEDFPALPIPFDSEDESHRLALREAVFSYFYAPDDKRAAKALAYMTRHFMSRYWQKVLSRDYL